MEKGVASAFYKYVPIDNINELQKELLEFCISIALKGRILVGDEGINGSVFGSKGQIAKFQDKIKSYTIFSGIEFKDQETSKPSFTKMFVRVRKEIAHFGQDVDLKNTAEFVSPARLKKMLDDKEEIILVDMRNNYEAMIGKFRGARTVNTRNFRDLPEHIHEISDLKDRKIVTYCTGGIRCEKASAYLKENGFTNVMQLQGGILKYGMEFPDTYWEGKCFVFDDRLAVPLNTVDAPLTDCVWCKNPCDDVINCHNLHCDRFMTICGECSALHKKSCSESCEKSEKRRKEMVLVTNANNS
jgi:UPF0176 protein